jgi:hypothetical protein
MARLSVEMMLLPEFFPNAETLYISSLKELLETSPKTVREARRRVDEPALRKRKKTQHLTNVYQASTIIKRGWWLMTYTHLLGVTIDPSYIINGTSTNKEN